MQKNQDKEQILESIRAGLKQARFKKFDNTVFDSEKIFITPEKPLFELFKEELLKISGECYYCINELELVQKLKEIHSSLNLEVCYSPDLKYKEILEQTQIEFIDTFCDAYSIKSGISSCEYLIARFGSVMVSSALAGGRRVFSFPEIHIVIANELQIVLELDDAIEGMQKRYGDELPSQIINITGPSRTADIEKTLILGAHGPKKFIVLVLKS